MSSPWPAFRSQLRQVFLGLFRSFFRCVFKFCFCWVLGAKRVPKREAFGSILGVKIGQVGSKTASSHLILLKIAIFTGAYVFQCFLLIFAFKIGAKTTQDRPKIAPSLLQEATFSLLNFDFVFGWILGRFWCQFGSQNGAKLAPNWLPKRTRNR